MEIVEIDIEKLIPDPENARTHDDKNLAAIRGSIKQFDVVEPLVVWKKNNVVLGGNGRLEVMKKMGFKTAPVHYVDLDDKKAKALALALNRTAELAEWNMERLQDQLKEIDDPELIGFDDDFIKIEDESTSTAEQDEKEDDVPEVDDNPYGVKRGDVWKLGNHRIMCGDSTDENDVAKLMAGEKADFGFCDPPYNLGFKYNSYDDNKTDSEYLEFSHSWFNNLKKYTTRQAVTLGTKNIPVMSNLDTVAGVACWVKKNWITSCHIAKLQQWEPIFFYGDYTKYKRTSDLYEINRVEQKDVGKSHSCPKQIKLIVEIFENYAGKSVLDLFQGSGTSIIACEKTNRTCYGMELDEHYMSVIIKRWEDYTGQKAERIEECQVEDLQNTKSDIAKT